MNKRLLAIQFCIRNLFLFNNAGLINPVFQMAFYLISSKSYGVSWYT